MLDSYSAIASKQSVVESSHPLKAFTTQTILCQKKLSTPYVAITRHITLVLPRYLSNCTRRWYIRRLKVYLGTSYGNVKQHLFSGNIFSIFLKFFKKLEKNFKKIDKRFLMQKDPDLTCPSGLNVKRKLNAEHKSTTYPYNIVIPSLLHSLFKLDPLATVIDCESMSLHSSMYKKRVEGERILSYAMLLWNWSG